MLVLQSSKRNFGFGQQMSYAGNVVLRRAASDHGGNYGSCYTKISRWRKFCQFCKARGISDARLVTEALIREYAEQIDGKVSTTHNDISCVNVVMRALTNGKWKTVSPLEIIGERRSAIRTEPVEISYIKVYLIYRDLVFAGDHRLALVPIFSFLLGLRRREASLLDLRQALKESKSNNHIDIFRGSKGGRSRTIERLVPSSPEVERFLQKAIELVGDDRCLVPSNIKYIDFSNQVSNRVLPVLKRHGIRKLHDLRAGYACNRYSELTGFPAPVNAKPEEKGPDAWADEAARKVISLELGHFRSGILNSYIGSWRLVHET